MTRDIIDERESIDVRWIPVAKACWQTVQEQIKMIEASIKRDEEHLKRYQNAKGVWQTVGLRIQIEGKEETLKTLKANLDGKTVAQ